MGPVLPGNNGGRQEGLPHLENKRGCDERGRCNEDAKWGPRLALYQVENVLVATRAKDMTGHDEKPTRQDYCLSPMGTHSRLN